MLIKIDSFKNAWINPDYIESVKIHDIGVDDYHVYINMNGNSYRIDSCDTYEEAMRVMDEAAETINAAQGYKGKVVMRYAGLGNGQKYGVFRCSHCRFAVSGPDYDCCPNCGREIERWE